MKKEEWLRGEIAKWRSGANEPKRFVSVKGGDHNSLVDDMGFENYYKLIEEFVDANNSASKNTKGTKEARQP